MEHKYSIEHLLGYLCSGDTMAKPAHRAYSRQNLEALELLAQMIRVGRIDRKMSAQEMADRAGISRPLLRRIESADPSCAIGSVFEVAVIAGVPLFGGRARSDRDTTFRIIGKTQPPAPESPQTEEGHPR